MTDRNLEELLCQAVAGNSITLVEHFINEGADVNYYGCWAAKQASRKGFLDILKCLHKAGVNLNHNNGECLWVAARYGKIHIVRFLLENGCDESLECAMKMARNYERKYVRIALEQHREKINCKQIKEVETYAE